MARRLVPPQVRAVPTDAVSSGKGEMNVGRIQHCQPRSWGQ